MTELEKIEREIHILQRKAHNLRKNIIPPHYDFNNDINVKIRANRLKISTVKKEIKNKTIKPNSMKSKLSVPTSDVEKYIVAARFAEVKVVDSKAVNPKKVSMVVSHSTANDLLEMGGFLATITTEQIKAEKEKISEEKAAAKEKEKAKK